ncbi:hypothetical protein [Mangrovitalea sediminis]|uniref:hypothetical protein n=1 Tax=Mangrovitalea sediminis TaxID=1982043 RepID=UPI000BE563DA|nr:hypothetical protein [Mangrovitalea sediminis]
MEEPSTYNVVIEGQLHSGFDIEQVCDALAAVFKVSPEKAATLLKSRRVLKKDVDQAVALKYKQKLESIGVVVTLERQAPPASAPQESPGLLLVPKDEEPDPEPSVSGGSSAPAKSQRLCPQCKSLQPVSARRCEACGFALHQVTSKAAVPDATIASVSREVQAALKGDLTPADMSTPVLLAGAAAALAGALIWYGIAMGTGYEVSFVAWVIGGGVGAAMVFAGGRGMTVTLIACSLTLVSIMGGKYMILLHAESKLRATYMSGPQLEEMKADYHHEMGLAKQYVDDVYDTKSLKQFMFDNHMSLAASADKVSSDDVALFNQQLKPRYENDVYNKVSFQTWQSKVFSDTEQQMDNISILKSSLRVTDFIFLFLGIFTAYKVVRKA